MSAPQNDDAIRALRANFMFASLSDEQLAAFAGQVWFEKIPAGSVIVREGEQADSLYVVVEGGVNVLKGAEQFLAYLGPGGFFGEMALFTEQSRRSATCQATVDSTCVVIRKAVLEQFCTSRPDAGLIIYRAIIRTLAERLQTTSADLAFLMGVHVRQQSAVQELVDGAKSRGRRPPGTPEI
ncbi:MAG: cyclic nucleotide-binding domain-containing protein [Deltaproteobacteria bacterium]|nr:cyclic nucleotide-binding domain-containing protein [Deltaproteobacteria bacterium]